MVAVRPSEAAALMRRTDIAAVVILLYGRNTGLISERGRRLAETAVDDPADPFQLVTLDGDAIASDPLRLLDEANTVGLFASRRAIRIKATSRNLAPVVGPLLAAPPPDTRVVVEAGDLNPTSPLRQLCEKAPNALAIPCNEDDAAAIDDLIAETMKAAGLSIDPEARDLLRGLLGGDRLTTRNELDKLTLFARGSGAVTADDVTAVVGDVSMLAIDQLVDACFLGRLAEVDRTFSRLRTEGNDPGVLIGFLMRHASTLLDGRLAMDDGAPASAAAGRLRIGYKRRGDAERQLRLWSSSALRKAITDGAAAVAACRRQPALAASAAETLMWSIVGSARRGGRAR